MKAILYAALFLRLVLVTASCDKNSAPEPEPTPTTGTIAGRVSLAPGVNGQIQNTRVAIYTTYDDWVNDRTYKFVGADGNGNYTFNNLPPGTYYLDAWKDNNNNTVWGDATDYVGVYGSGSYPNYQASPVTVIAGQVTTVNLELFVVQ